MAAWEVCPPRAVRMPSAALISLMSSGTVSKRRRMSGALGSSRRKYSMSSSVKTTRPERAPPETPMPRPTKDFSSSSLGTKILMRGLSSLVTMSRLWRMKSFSLSGPSKVNSIS